MRQSELIMYIVEQGLTPDEAITIVRYDFKQALKLLNKMRYEKSHQKNNK